MSEPAAPEAPDALDAPAQARRWPRVEGYRVVAPLGRGGMGTVWRATELSTGRDVALKLIAGSAFGARTARARFEREVDALARLEHPHIARLYYSGVDQDVCFYAMALIEGVHLDRYVQQHRLSQRRVLALMQKVCAAIDHAHQRGVMHRDLKPANIIVDAEGTPCVVDFGLAKSLAPSQEGLAISMDGAISGTLQYMAPEQAAGDVAGTDSRCDIYSLGVILFQLLTGQLPHEPGGTLYETQRRIIEQPVRRPRALDRTISGELEAILLKALAKAPEERYATAGALAQDLHNYLQGDLISARPLTMGYFLRKRLWRHRGRVAAALVMLLVLLVGGAYNYHRVTTERNRATAAAEQAERALYLNRIAFARAELERNQLDQAQALLESCPEHLRGWEWSYLYQQTDQSLWSVDAGRARIEALAGLPGQDRFVTLDETGTWRLWDATSGELLRQVALSDEPPQAVALSNNGTHVALAHADRIEVYSERLEGPVAIGFAPVTPDRLAIDNAGRYIALADTGRRLRVWSLTNEEVIVDATLPAGCEKMKFGASGSLVGGGDQMLFVFEEIARHSQIRYLNADEWITAVAISPSGRWIVTGDTRALTRVWDTQNGEVLAELAGHDDDVLTIAFNSEETRILSAGRDRLVNVWAWPAGRLEAVYHGHRAPVQAAAFAGGQQPLVLSAGEGQELLAWDLARSPTGQRRIDTGGKATLTSLAYAPDGSCMVVGDWEGRVTIISTGTEDSRQLLTCPAMVSALTYSRDGKWLAIADNSGVVRVLDTGHMLEVGRFMHPAGPAVSLAFAPDEPFLAAGALSVPGVVVWDVKSARQAAVLDGVGPVAFTPNGAYLIAPSADYSKLIGWTVDSWRSQTWWNSHSDVILALAVSPSGHRIAATGRTGALALWDADRPRSDPQITPHLDSWTNAVAFHPDGQRIAVGGNGIHVLDATSGGLLLTLEDDGQNAHQAVAFSPNGQALSASTGREILQWSRSAPFYTTP